jgi:hypothetical protein
MNTAEVQLLTRKDVARLMKISLGTLTEFVDQGILPKFRPFGTGRLLYIRKDDYFAAVNAMLPRAPATRVAPLAAPTPAPTPAPVMMPPPPPVSKGRPKYRGSATDRARQREAKLLAQMNS